MFIIVLRKIRDKITESFIVETLNNLTENKIKLNYFFVINVKNFLLA